MPESLSCKPEDWNSGTGVRSKKISCFQKCGWLEKSSPGRVQICFFNRFSGDSLFSSLVSFAFFAFLFFLACLLFFMKLKIYIVINIWLCRRVSDKTNFPLADFRKLDYFFWPHVKFLKNFCIYCLKRNRVVVIDNFLSLFKLFCIIFHFYLCSG